MNKPDCKTLEDTQDIMDTPSLYNWLQAKAKQYQFQNLLSHGDDRVIWLLAHADDGVIWGKFRGDDYKLVTSGDEDVFPQLAKLRSPTLQQCRIFGKNAEVMLWKVGQNWKARLVQDDNKPKCLPDEDQILWGTKVEKESKGFSLVSDGSQGLKHAVPLTGITFTGKDSRPLRLKVRHYIDYDDESGVARIYLSRLVDLYSHPKK
ncbi:MULTISPECIES: type III-D CRISPR-associated protein Csx19 [unclassified Microcoleus]|uniref:type III-D CRISPR-associated protein Csx19 n=1 Tax=unclassified Microcoleus TaxID=2642155 RepID=UPI002FD61DE3